MKYFYIFLSAVLAFPATTYAQAPVNLPNPLGISDPRLLAARLIDGVLSIVGVLALVMVIYGGILWMTAGGKSENVKKGRDVLLWSVIGIIVIASAFVVTNAVFNAVLTGDVAGN